MNYRLITECLNEKHLQSPNLSILEQDAHLYNTLLLQPSGIISYGNDFIKLEDENLANAKFGSFFDIALEKDVELAITPEYSCPWQVLNNLIDSDILPNENKLWVVGCQSIKASELNEFIASKNQIIWIVDQTKINLNLNNNHFFDPVCYIFKTKEQNSNAIRTTITIQFKTHPLGGEAMEWERNSLICGDCIYVLENSNNSSRLVTLICSDSLNQALIIENLPQFVNIPYLILHIQLNQAPNHTLYASYRRNTFAQGRENKEFICLNWARNVIIDNSAWNKYGGSAMYIKTEKEDEITVTDQHLNKNQKLGLHFTFWKEKYANIFLLDYDEHVFLLRNTKPSQQSALPVNRKRTGPEMQNVYSWNAETNLWEAIERVANGFEQLCNELENGQTNATILNYNNDNPIDTERLVYLSNGKAISKGWSNPKKISFLLIKDDEINKKITFNHNPCIDTHAERKKYLLQYSTLEYSIITNPTLIPPNISDLKNNCKIDYRHGSHSDDINLNLYPITEEGVPGCGVYIGHSTATDAYNLLTKLIGLFDQDHFGKRAVVWYLDQGATVQFRYNPEKPKFTENTSKTNRSISSNKIR